MGRGAWAEIEPLLMMRPPRGVWSLHHPEGLAGAEEGAGQVDVDDRSPLLDGQVFERDRRRAHPRVVEEEVEAAEGPRSPRTAPGPTPGSATSVGTARARAPAGPGLAGGLRQRLGAAPGEGDGVAPRGAASAAARPIPEPAPVTIATLLMTRASPVACPRGKLRPARAAVKPSHRIFVGWAPAFGAATCLIRRHRRSGGVRSRRPTRSTRNSSQPS